MTKRVFLTAAAMMLSPIPAVAQTQPSPAPTTTLAPVDPDRLAAARPVIDQVWPLGTYERIMHAVMDQVVNNTMASMYDMPIDQFAKGMGEKDTGKLAGKTFRDVMKAEDPYFEERGKRTMKVMTDEMIGLMNEIEPDVRVALANAYARRFTVAQLNDLHAFFDTPTGKIYAAESMTMMMGPDMMQAMQSFMPKFMERMPAIIAKVEASTKDLPPPPKRKPGK